MLKKLILGVFLSLFMVGTANAWYLEIGAAYQTATYGYYKCDVDMNFVTGETPGSLNYQTQSLVVTWAGDASLTSQSVPIYWDGSSKTPAWEAVSLPWGTTTGGLGNIAYAVMAAETLGHPGYMYPVDNDITSYLWFNANPGDVQFTSYLLGGTVEQLKLEIDDTWRILGALSPDGLVLRSGNHQLTPIPIPGSIYLFASVLIGLIGLRRRINKSLKAVRP